MDTSPSSGEQQGAEAPQPGTSSVSPSEPQQRTEIDISETQGARLGTCKWFNVSKGWGFITPKDGGQDVFVHQSVIKMAGFRSLGENELVEFECKITERGLEATRVSGPEQADCSGSSRRPRVGKRYRRMRCYNCGEFSNHLATDCPQGPQPKRCHNCHSDDHLVADCPNAKKKSTKEKTAGLEEE